MTDDEELDRLFSPEPPREVPNYWQPIETAPRDGTSMLLCRWDSNDQDVLPVVSGFWSRLSEVWFAEMVGRNVTPTHWMALPAPPRL